MANDNKTRATTTDPRGFIAAVPDATRRQDAEVILEMMERITGEPPAMWGDTIVGFGSYHYRYDSGREGDYFRVGFSPRKANLTLYLMARTERGDALLSRLGRHTTGKSCLYVKKLADVDLEVLEALVTHTVEEMDRRYPR